MIKRVLYNGVTWVDLESPTSEEVSAVAAEFSLHPVVSSELLSQSLRPKIDLHSHYTYLILHFIDDKEVDFILGDKFIITTRYEDVEPVTKLFRSLSLGEQLHSKELNSGVAANGQRRFKTTKGDSKPLRVWWVPAFNSEVLVPAIVVQDSEVPF